MSDVMADNVPTICIEPKMGDPVLITSSHDLKLEASETSSIVDSSITSEDSEYDISMEKSSMQLLESKIAYIKHTTKVDHVNRALYHSILFTIVIYLLTFVIALVVLSTLPKPSSYIQFSDKLLEQGKDIYEAIYAVEANLIEYYSEDILTALTSNHITQHYWPCTFGPDYTFAVLNVSNLPTGEIKTLTQCTFITKNGFKDRLKPSSDSLLALQSWITQNYPLIRRKGDIFDKEFTAPFTYYEFYGVDVIVNQTIPNWNDFISSKITDAVSKLSYNHDFFELVAQLDFAFISKNRKIADQRISTIQQSLFDQIRYNRMQELIIHLIFSILLFVFPLALGMLLILPSIQKLQAERLTLIKLLLLVPKSLVWDLVYVTYKENGEGDDQDADENQSLEAAQKLALNKAKARLMKTDDVIEVIDDSQKRLLILLSMVFFSIAIPVIAHCGWRYADNKAADITLSRYGDIITLYNSFHALRQEGIVLFLPKAVTPTSFKPYWDDILPASEEFKKLSDAVNI